MQRRITPKILIDNIARPIAKDVEKLYKRTWPDIEIQHSTDIYKESRCDRVWVRDCANKGGWIAISSDLGNHSTKNGQKPKLPMLCKEYGLTCIQLTPTLAKERADTHREVILHVIQNLDAILRCPEGTIIRIGRELRRGGIEAYVFKVRDRRPPISLGSFLNEISKKPGV